jgi:replication initiator protein A
LFVNIIIDKYEGLIKCKSLNTKRKENAMSDEAAAKLKALQAAQRRKIEAAARPGETYEQAAARIRQKEENTLPHKSHIRQAPSSEKQTDIFVPTLYDVGTRDSRSIMDVAVFRLSKREKRAGEIIRYDLPDGYVEVKAGPDGMASIWDYDIVLMLISHLTDAMNRYCEGKEDKPGHTFRPHVGEILKFCRKGDGGRQIEEVERALDRLRGTTIKSVRERPAIGGKRGLREIKTEGLIGDYTVLSYTDTGKIAAVEIETPIIS